MAADGVEALLHHESGEREVAVQRLRSAAWLIAGAASTAASVLWVAPLGQALVQVFWGLACMVLVWRADVLRRWPAIGVVLSTIDAVLIMINTTSFNAMLMKVAPTAAIHQVHASGIGFTLVIATGALRFTPRLSAALCVWTMGCYATTLTLNGAIDPGIVPDLTLFAVLGALSTFAAYRQRWLIQRGFERDALARYLPGPAVERIAKDPADRRMGGVLVEATVMFCDLRGFTELASKATPDRVVATVNEWFAEAVAETHAHGGVVDKFVGDAILVVFAGSDGAARALRCGLGWMSRLARLNAARARRNEDPLRVGVGAHTGQLVAGNIGSPERLEYTHIGDVVNVAARVQDLTKQYQEPLLVTADVWKAAALAGIEGRDVGETRVRGREAPVRLYGVG
jgi:adenylate cyclase